MENSTDSAGVRPIFFAETQLGVLAGFWYVPVEGFAWRRDVQPFASFTEDRPADEGPWLVANGLGVRRYPMLTRSGLLPALDRLSLAPNDEAIVHFANQWGALGEEQVLVTVRKEPSSEAQFVGGMPSGESRSSWITSLLKFRDLRALAQAVAIASAPESWPSDRAGQAKALIESRVGWNERGACWYSSQIDDENGTYGRTEWFIDPDADNSVTLSGIVARRDTIAAARFFVFRSVNSELRGHVNPSLLPFVDGDLRFFPDSLIAAAWLKFGLELTGRSGRMRECERCGLPFAQRRRDQRFCGKNCQEASAYQRRRKSATTLNA